VIKTIFFDIGGVLVDLHPERTGEIMEEVTGLPAHQIEDIFPYEAHHEYERGHLDDHRFFEAVKNTLPDSLELKEADFWKAWMAMVGKPKRTASWIPRLRESVPVWLLSNTNRYHVEHLLPDYSFYRNVDGSIFSFETGFRKPEPGIFMEALRRCNLQPDEAVFIDDLETNVCAAAELGIKAVQFVSPRQLATELQSLGFSVE